MFAGCFFFFPISWHRAPRFKGFVTEPNNWWKWHLTHKRRTTPNISELVGFFFLMRSTICQIWLPLVALVIWLTVLMKWESTALNLSPSVGFMPAGDVSTTHGPPLKEGRRWKVCVWGWGRGAQGDRGALLQRQVDPSVHLLCPSSLVPHVSRSLIFSSLSKTGTTLNIQPEYFELSRRYVVFMFCGAMLCFSHNFWLIWSVDWDYVARVKALTPPNLELSSLNGSRVSFYWAPDCHWGTFFMCQLNINTCTGRRILSKLFQVIGKKESVVLNSKKT